MLDLIDVGTLPLENFDTVLAPTAAHALHRAEVLSHIELAGRRIWNVNTRARGGAVAELLTPLLAYAHGSGIDARMAVIDADAAFLQITRRLHQLLGGMPGDGGPLGVAEQTFYEAELAGPADDLCARVREGDFVVLHDPETAGLIGRLRATGARVIWRCHVGVEVPNDCTRVAWRFLAPYVRLADAYVFTRAAHVWEGLDPAKRAVIAPSIDVFTPKNAELDPDAVRAILKASRLCAPDPGAPPPRRSDGRPWPAARVLETRPLTVDERYVLQVSPWDSLKDPIGVIEGFAEHVAPYTDAHLIVAGPDVHAVGEEPLGTTVYDLACARWHALPDAVRERIHLARLPILDAGENALIVNALERHAAVVVQKSLAEGYGLTVAEAMWKRCPVVASRIGGIQDQIEHGVSGILLDDPSDLPAFGAAVLALLGDPERAMAFGEAARERVRERYLGTHSLLEYLRLFERLL